DIVTAYDQNNSFSSLYTVTNSDIQAQDTVFGLPIHGPITFFGGVVKELRLKATSGNTLGTSTINITGSPSSLLQVDAGALTNTINVGDGSDRLDSFGTSQLTINGQGGGDQLYIKDKGTATGQGYYIGNSTVDRNGGVSIRYYGMQGVQLSTGKY